MDRALDSEIFHTIRQCVTFFKMFCAISDIAFNKRKRKIQSKSDLYQID